MFRALDSIQGRAIVALDPQWEPGDGLTSLRQWCRDDRIQCPWCHAPVIIRAGEILRRHFAHKTNDNCPYAHEDEEKLAGRQILYDWAVSKFGVEHIEIEATVDGFSLPSPLDLLVKHEGRRFGYWFLHRNVRKTDARDEIRHAIDEHGQKDLHLHLVWSGELLKPIPSDPALVRLSTSQRELLARSDYDRTHGGDRNLTFLDTKTSVVTTLRALAHFEGPQTFEVGKQFTSPIGDVRIRPSNGELVHPGEHEAFKAWEIEEARRREELQTRLQEAIDLRDKDAAWLKRAHERFQQEIGDQPAAIEDSGTTVGLSPQSSPLRPLSFAVPEPIADEEYLASINRNRAAVCELCGQLIHEDDWIIYIGTTKTCKCRGCIGPKQSESK